MQSVTLPDETFESLKEKANAKPLGVCLLATDVDTPTGGIQSISFNLLNELNRRGNKTFVCTRNYQRTKKREEVRNGTLIHRAPTFSRFFAAFNAVSYLIDGLLFLIRHRKDYDVIHCQQMFAPAMLGLLARSILGKPVLIGVHRTGETGEVNDIRKIMFSGLRLRQLKQADGWAVLSEEMREELESLDIPPEKINFVPNAVVLSETIGYEAGVKENYRAKLDLPYQKIAVFTGRLSAEKGLDTLLKAWAKVHEHFPQAHLLILGKGEIFYNIEDELRSLRESLKLAEVIHFLGFKPNPLDYLLAANVFVLPSRSEGMSCSLIEAMSTGTAIVASDIRGNHALCETEVNSLTFPLDDADALAQALVRILDDPDFEEKLGRAARQKAERDLTVEVMTDRYLKLYAALQKNSSSYAS